MELRLQPNKVRNRLLGALSVDELQVVVQQMQAIDLPRGFNLSHANVEPAFCYFLESGIGSIVAKSPDGNQAEVGLFGFDGMTPTTLVLDSGPPSHSIFMQVPGDGYRITTERLAQIIGELPSLRRILLRYALTLSLQTAGTALSNAVHTVDEGLARWILMCDDRTDGNSIALTHEFLAIMLAVRRASVTTALHVLEGNRLIEARRGVIMVRDRDALEEFTGDAYGYPEAEYRRLIGPFQGTCADDRHGLHLRTTY